MDIERPLWTASTASIQLGDHSPRMGGAQPAASHEVLSVSESQSRDADLAVEVFDRISKGPPLHTEGFCLVPLTRAQADSLNRSVSPLLAWSYAFAGVAGKASTILLELAAPCSSLGDTKRVCDLPLGDVVLSVEGEVSGGIGLRIRSSRRSPERGRARMNMSSSSPLDCSHCCGRHLVPTGRSVSGFGSLFCCGWGAYSRFPRSSWQAFGLDILGICLGSSGLTFFSTGQVLKS